MDWENRKERNPIQKTEKTVNIKLNLPHVNKKPLARKRIFIQTPFSYSTFLLKFEQKKFTPQNHSFFRSTSCFGVTKITTAITTSKIIKLCEQILKKDSAPIQFKFFEL